MQLTAFGRSDTTYARSTLDGTRVLFAASADPLGTNPKRACEFFSIDALGGDLRQLTHFGSSIPEGCNCGSASCEPPHCTITGPGAQLDRSTGSMVLPSSCDPSNAYGEQVFAMRPDGTGLRQLTFASGLREGADGSLAVEVAGPWAIPARYR